MDLKIWEKIKSEVKNAPPLARIRKLHPIIQNPRIPKSIRDEARELAKKARLELDSEHFWKWGGVSLLPTRRLPQIEEIREEKPKRSLEQTVEAAAPDVKPKETENLIKGEYASKSGEEYVTQGYFGKTAYDSTTETKGAQVTQATELLAPTETKYHRNKTKKKSIY